MEFMIKMYQNNEGSRFFILNYCKDCVLIMIIKMMNVLLIIKEVEFFKISPLRENLEKLESFFIEKKELFIEIFKAKASYFPKEKHYLNPLLISKFGKIKAEKVSIFSTCSSLKKICEKLIGTDIKFISPNYKNLVKERLTLEKRIENVQLSACKYSTRMNVRKESVNNPFRYLKRK